MPAYLVDLVHHSLESTEAGREEDTSKRESVTAIVAHRQQMGSSIGTSDNDDVVAAAILLIVRLRDGLDWSSLDFVRAREHRSSSECGVNGGAVSCVDGSMGGNRKRRTADRVNTLTNDGVEGAWSWHAGWK